MMNPDSAGPLYCAEQIKIPADLPDILKEFTKAAIRTQPDDVLQWSAAYFDTLLRGEVLPTKLRFEARTTEMAGGVSKGTLAMLHRQLGQQKFVAVNVLSEKWTQAGCALNRLDELLSLGDIQKDHIEWEKLLAVACTVLDKSLAGALQILCEILTSDPDGGGARISVEQFSSLYSYLVGLDGSLLKENKSAVLKFLSDEAKRYGGKVGPREFMLACNLRTV